MSTTNPLATESTISKIKTKFNKKNNTESNISSITVELVGMNRAIDICSEACACCWDKQIPDDYAGRAEYVAKRTRTNHTSILEHSNFVIYLRINNSHIDDFINFISWNRYLHKKVCRNSNGEWCVLLGGTYRAFSDIYLNADDLNNQVLKSISKFLYTYAPSAAFEDICKYGLMNKDMFIDVEPDDEHFKILTSYYKNPDADHDLFTVIGLDNIKTLYTNLYNIDSEFATSLTTGDLLEFVTVTVMFKNMSRTCTHQLVRHRNGITQESQRYVDYSQACFSSPALFKPDKYDPNHKYKVRFGPSSTMNLTLDEIGEAMCQVYGMLSNPVLTGGDHVLLKEDARAFLPGNVQCRKIFITFTYRMLFKFMQLRESKGAQAEIKMYATEFANWFREHTDFCTKEITDTYTLPKLLIEDPFKIDADEGVEETVVNITEDDYIKAAGLDKPSEE